MTRAGITLNYLVAGTGPAMVLLHGLAGSSWEFEPTIAALLPGYRVVALDQRGHGRSTRRPVDVSREAYVLDVAALIEGLSPGEREKVAARAGTLCVDIPRAGHDAHLENFPAWIRALREFLDWAQTPRLIAAVERSTLAAGAGNT